MQIDEGMIITDYMLVQDNIMVVFEIDESVYSMSDFIDNQELIKSSIIEELLKDPEGKSMLDLCKVSHSGLVYRMVGNNTQKSLDIVISQEEIRQYDPMPSNVTIR
jgi:phage pi2 protein 07